MEGLVDCLYVVAIYNDSMGSTGGRVGGGGVRRRESRVSSRMGVGSRGGRVGSAAGGGGVKRRESRVSSR